MADLLELPTIVDFHVVPVFHRLVYYARKSTFVPWLATCCTGCCTSLRCCGPASITMMVKIGCLFHLLLGFVLFYVCGHRDHEISHKLLRGVLDRYLADQCTERDDLSAHPAYANNDGARRLQSGLLAAN